MFLSPCCCWTSWTTHNACCFSASPHPLAPTPSVLTVHHHVLKRSYRGAPSLKVGTRLAKIQDKSFFFGFSSPNWSFDYHVMVKWWHVPINMGSCIFDLNPTRHKNKILEYPTKLFSPFGIWIRYWNIPLSFFSTQIEILEYPTKTLFPTRHYNKYLEFPT